MRRVVAEEGGEEVRESREREKGVEKRGGEEVVDLGGGSIGSGEERAQQLEDAEVELVLSGVVRVLDDCGDVLRLQRRRSAHREER